MEYEVEACVSISGQVELADVRATLQLENAGSEVTYTTLARCLCVSKAVILKCSENVKGEQVRKGLMRVVRSEC